ncbi:LamG-like jellyroll fold domain-containing protein [Nannocystaceae bacterium ST9]
MKLSPLFVCVAFLSVGWSSVGCGEVSSDEDQDSGEFREGLADGLLLHWTFEDRNGTQILDVSGNNRHGVLQGGASFLASPVGEAVVLDGVDDFVSFTGPRDPALYGGVDGDFTISARVRVANVGKYNTLCYGCGPFSAMYVGTPIYGARSMSGLFNKSNNGILWPWTTQSLVADTWVDVTLVVDGGVRARHYRDCTLDAELVNANLGLKNYNSSSFGKGTQAATWFQGQVDELRIWNRALSDAEIAEICPPPPGLCDGPIHVDVDAAAGGDGLSWATAFDDLQAALDAAQTESCVNPEIWVAEGTYAPDPAAPVVTIRQPMSLYGGFAGSETTLAQRDFVTHPVRLGADAWQSRVVVVEATALDEVDPLRVDGFTISGSDAGAISITSNLDPSPPKTVSFHNLEITDNSAVRGAGFLVTGAGTFELVDSHFQANVASEAGAAIYHENVTWFVEGSSFVANQSAGATIREAWTVGVSHSGGLHLSDSVMSNNVGGAVRGASVIATNTEFSGNTASIGAAIHVSEQTLSATGCQFTANQATNYGGAIYIKDLGGAEDYELIDSSFTDNTAKWGGAVYVVDAPAGAVRVNLHVEGSEFVNNTASIGGGGALYLQESITSVEGTLFADNTAAFGGAIHIDNLAAAPTEVGVIDSRFIANEATGTGGGGILIEEPITVTDSEFVANIAKTGGGGVFGRATLVGVTFANNLAATGRAVYAPPGAQMTLRNVVAWPDTLVAASMFLDHSCVPAIAQAFTSSGHVKLVADPFAPADLDLDGRTEFYLSPSAPCVDIGGTVVEFDWATQTTQASQCTDTTPVDAGVHYTPQSAVGPC